MFLSWRNEISRILPSKYRWFKVLPRELGESSWDWHCLDQPIHSLTLCGCSFPSSFHRSWMGPEDATTPKSFINLEGEMICHSREPTRTSVGFYQQSCWKRSQDGIPDLSQPSSTRSSPQPALEKLQLTQGEKLEIFSRDTLTLSHQTTPQSKGDGKQGRVSAECVCPSQGFPQHSGNAQTRSGSAGRELARGRSRAKPWPVIHEARKSCLSWGTAALHKCPDPLIPTAHRNLTEIPVME